ncbi:MULTISPECIES: phytanoyl-CoA dioxygenase family protein [Burkholderia]|uniref:phytanoyl-CoA dioxygenase family protein n=1 Tax=Burkholderia TaxID=32008 RepID=UPI000AD3F3C0|nr:MULTISPECIES: phytanoyl-CoA dioxygenase family protein [unclassified Burkholderia]
MKLQAKFAEDGTAGILTYTLHGTGRLKPNAEISIQVAGRQDIQLSAARAADLPIDIHIHTHLFENGTYTLQAKAKSGWLGDTIRAQTVFKIEHRDGLAVKVSSLLAEAGTPPVFAGDCDSSYYPYDETAATPWFDRPDADEHIAALLRSGEISGTEASALRQFVKDGFMILEDVIDDALVDAVNAEIEDAIERKYQNYEFGTSQRIEHLHLHYPNIRKLWLDRRHLRLADLVFNARARPCQTLTYVFGSQQDAHQDTVHLTPFPAGYMCGIWIALQDICANSGELVVYPGSHREPRIYLNGTGCNKVRSDWSEFGAKIVPKYQEMSARYTPFVYRPKKGTVLIWHENLLHAGSVRLDQSLPRRSVVIHAFADGAIGYYDSTGIAASAVPFTEIAAFAGN